MTKRPALRTALHFLLISISALTAHAETIKIVSSLPRTGSANSQTTSMVNGIKMAIAEVGGKVGPYTISYEDWDDASPERGAWDATLEAANADRAIRDPDVMAYVGPYNSGAAKISMPKLNQAGLLMVSPGNTAVGLTKPGLGEPGEPDIYRPSGKITYFRVVPADDIQGSQGAKWAAAMGAKKIYILHDRETYGQGIATVFRKKALELGLQVLAFEGIDTKASNYRSLATKIKQSQVHLVYYGGTTQSNSGQIVKDMRSSGVKAPYMVPDGNFENAFIQAAGKENLEGSTFITFGGLPSSMLQGKGAEFVAAYKKQYGAEPEAYAAYGYEAAMVVLDGIKRAGVKDRAKIIEAVAATKDFEGALGRWSFDANGDTTLTTMSGNTVRNGQFEFVKILAD